MTLDAVHAALYASLIGASAALGSQFLAQWISALRDDRGRRRREERTKALFLALVQAPTFGFSVLHGEVLLSNGADIEASDFAAMSLGERIHHFDRLVQPLRDAIGNHDLLRDLPADAVFEVLAFSDTYYWAVESLKTESVVEAKRISETLKTDEVHADALVSYWQRVAETIQRVEEQYKVAGMLLKAKDAEVMATGLTSRAAG
jgi:hypothetical protein